MVGFWNKKERGDAAPGGEQQAASGSANSEESVVSAGFQAGQIDRAGEDSQKPLTPFLPGTIVQGKLSFSGPVKLEGQLSGEIFSSSAVIVSAEALVDGRLDVESLHVYGQVKGKVRTRLAVHVHAGGEVSAEVDAASLIIEEGGRFNGDCRMRVVSPRG